MSKPHYDWWSYVKKMIGKYPTLCEQHAAAAVAVGRVTPSYSGMPGGGNLAHRTTEDAAIAQMSKTSERAYEGIKLAIAQTDRMRDGGDRIALIRMMYWSRSHTINGAADMLHISTSTARRWHRAFVQLCGFNMGFD